MKLVNVIRMIDHVEPPLKDILLNILEAIELQYEELSQQVTKTEFNELKEIVARLAEAQERTDCRLEELAKAQERTERRLEELAKAQKKTEKELAKLIGEHKVTRERLEGLSDTVGYTLENHAYKGLPKILKDMGITVEGRLIRKYLVVGDRERQVNIFGEARRDGERMLILGEAKVRPSKKEINRFMGLCRRMAEEKDMPIFKVFVAHDFPPKIEAYIREKDILPVWSYELD